MKTLFCLLLLSVATFAEEKPNVLLIIADDQGYGDFYTHGNTVLQTPHLDRLAAQATLGGVRVPCWVRWPARFPEPRAVREIAAHIDLLPRLAELAGIQDARTLPLDGRSLVPLMEGRAAVWPERTLFIQNTPQSARVTGSARTQRWHLVNEGKAWMLFDLEADPGEQNDVSAEHAEVAETLRAAYEKWWVEVSAGVREKRPPIPVGHAEENPVELSIAQAELTGGVKFNNQYPNNAWALAWDQPDARATWALDVATAGEYEVTLHFLNTAPAAAVRVKTAATALEATLPQTPRKQVPSPDRVPRKETHEMEWSTHAAGSLHLAAGPQTLILEAPAGVPALELKAVSLRRSAR